MLDITGQELCIGDRVVFMTTRHRRLQIGTILRIGKCKLTICGKEEYPTYYTKPKKLKEQNYIQSPYQVYKIKED